MAKSKGKGVVLAGLIAGVLSFLSKKENRDKAMSYLGQLKKEANSSQKGSANVQQKVDEFFNATQGAKNTTNTKDEKIASFMAMSPNATEKPQKETVFDNNIGRDVDELLRVLQALQTGGLCPVNWRPGGATL